MHYLIIHLQLQIINKYNFLNQIVLILILIFNLCMNHKLLNFKLLKIINNYYKIQMFVFVILVVIHLMVYSFQKINNKYIILLI